MSQENIDSLPGVKLELGMTQESCEEYVIVTGQYTHYLRPEPTIPDCPHHDWDFSNQQGCAEPQRYRIHRNTDVDTRSSFISGENHHCSHQRVYNIKSGQIPPQRAGCGVRSGKPRSAFCEIWYFEKFLCCRTCVYESVCAKAQVFKLPCQHKNDSSISVRQAEDSLSQSSLA